MVKIVIVADSLLFSIEVKYYDYDRDSITKIHTLQAPIVEITYYVSRRARNNRHRHVVKILICKNAEKMRGRYETKVSYLTVRCLTFCWPKTSSTEGMCES